MIDDDFKKTKTLPRSLPFLISPTLLLPSPFKSARSPTIRSEQLKLALVTLAADSCHNSLATYRIPFPRKLARQNKRGNDCFLSNLFQHLSATDVTSNSLNGF